MLKFKVTYIEGSEEKERVLEAAGWRKPPRELLAELKAYGSKVADGFLKRRLIGQRTGTRSLQNLRCPSCATASGRCLDSPLYPHDHRHGVSLGRIADFLNTNGTPQHTEASSGIGL